MPTAAFAAESMQNVSISADGVLSWDAVPGAAKYSVLVGNGGGDVTETSDDLNSRCATLGFDTGDYAVKLYAMDSAGNRITETWIGTFHYVSTQEQLAVPTNLRFEGSTCKWDAVPHATSYIVALMDEGDHPLGSQDTTDTQYTFTLTAGKTYKFSVRAKADGYVDSKATSSLYTYNGAPATITVTYDANGGTGTMAQETYTPDSSGIVKDFMVPQCGFTAPAGKEFDRWEDQNGAKQDAGDNVWLVMDMVYKAIWKDSTIPLPTTYTVTFNMNGHGSQIADQTVNEGAKATKPADPTASGWTFGGWYTDTALTAAYDFNTAVTADLTLYARWTQPVPVTYSVTFNANGGSVTPESSKTGTDGKLASLPAPARSGSYSFNGWYTAASGGTRVTVDKVYTADTTIYAHWTYTGGSGGSSSGGIAVSGSVRSSSVPSWVEKTGTWSQDAEGAWSYTNNGVMYRSCWACVYNPYANPQAGQRMYDWFWFDGNAKMYAGWLDWTDGNRYYLNPVHDGTYGAMLTGWKEIDGKWYYFNGTEGSGSMGAMLHDTTTPDGYRIGADGVWMP